MHTNIGLPKQIQTMQSGTMFPSLRGDIKISSYNRVHSIPEKSKQTDHKKTDPSAI
jgi:hypothetical protein